MTNDAAGYTYTWNAEDEQTSATVSGTATNYTYDGLGERVEKSSGTPVNYNIFGEPTAVDFGSQDSDAFTYDPNTGRLTQYSFNVNGGTDVGTLGWNANGTVASLAINDALNSADTQTCTFGYDDLTRITKQSCGTVWSQTFSADVFGNLTKSGSTSFQPTWNSPNNNRVNSVGGISVTYDANGNLTYDTLHHYTWDSDGKMYNVDSSTVTYDALDRVVEILAGTYTQVVYDPLGNKLALMSGQTLTKAFVGLPGGATAVYNSSGLQYYRHSDWLGSSRLASTTSRTVYYDGAYAAYGENYAEAGTQDRNFTGQDQDIVPSGAYPLYDFLMREYHPTWGRWLSPDPAGLATVNPGNPQSWNRYAYVMNNPTNFVDPLGLFMAVPPGCIENSTSDGYYCPQPGPGGGGGSSSGPCTDVVLASGNGLGGGGMVANVSPCGGGTASGGGGGGSNPPGLPSFTKQQYETCANEAFGATSGSIPATGRAAGTIPGYDLALAEFQAALLSGTPPQTLGATVALERPTTTLNPPNLPAFGNNVDVGPANIDTMNQSAPFVLPGTFGTNRGPHEPFNGDPLANLATGGKMLNLYGVAAYVGQKLAPQREANFEAIIGALTDFFDCLAGVSVP